MKRDFSWYYSYYSFKFKTFIKNYWKSLLKLLLWVVLYYYFIKFEFGVVYFIFSLFYLIFSNLGNKENNSLSAYSVFNKNFQQIPGTITSESLLGDLNLPKRFFFSF
jgi:hypothetical protein